MALSGTMSSPSDWQQFNQQNLFGQAQITRPTMSTDHGVSNATAVTTTITTSILANPSGTGNISPSSSHHLNPEGRVSKPVRRRSRASRRTPTTLLNTDTTNFRAMVQQFTGGPSVANFNFGLGSQQALNPRPFMVPSGLQVHFQQRQQPSPHQQLQYQPHHHQQWMLSLNNNNINHADGFLQRFGSSRPNSVQHSEGFSADDISSHVPRRSSPSSENRNGNNYMF